MLLARPAWRRADGPTLNDTVSSINTVWVIVAGVLVMFMQAGFAMLEIGFSRAKNAGTASRRSSPTSRSPRSATGRSALRWPSAEPGTIGATTACSWRARCPSRRRSSSRASASPRHQRGDVPVLPVRVLRGLAGDRLGHDARADQVRRLRDLRDRVRLRHLSDRLALGLRRRLAAGERRDAGLRRIDGCPPDRRHGRLRGAAPAGSRGAASTGRTANHARYRDTRCRSPASAC